MQNRVTKSQIAESQHAFNDDDATALGPHDPIDDDDGVTSARIRRPFSDVRASTLYIIMRALYVLCT